VASRRKCGQSDVPLRLVKKTPHAKINKNQALGRGTKVKASVSPDCMPISSNVLCAVHNLIGREPRKDRGERLTGLSSRLGFDRLAHIIPTFARNPGPPVQHPASDVPPALAAFLRGSERRAWVFLWLQGGDPEAADQALAAATRAFQAEAAQLPMADWPGRYWRLLAACPLDSGRGE